MENNQDLTRHARRQMARAAKEARYQKEHRRGKGGKVVATLVILGMITLGIWALAKKGSNAPDANPNEVRAEDHVKGPDSAVVTLIEYSDFQCPACGAYYPVIKQLSEAFPKDLRVIYRHFPLTQIHPNAFPSATAAEAAGMQGKFWEMHDLLFARQNDWSSLADPKKKFAEYARELALNETLFTATATMDAAEGRVDADRALANRLRVQSTPTFYVNGTKITTNPTSFDAFKQIIQSAVTTAQAGQPPAPQYHAHADLRVVLNGKAFDFSPAKYQSSKAQPLDPQIHFHDGKGNIIHMHTDDANMSRLFSSFDMQLAKTCLTLDARTKYCNSGNRTLRMYVNNQEVADPSLYVPKDLDRILVVYGQENNNQINALVKTVTDEACIYSAKCPERGKPPIEECVGGLGSGCE